jgi:hypothetical protein
MNKYLFLVLSALTCNGLTLQAREVVPTAQASVAQPSDINKSLEYAYIYNETADLTAKVGASVTFNSNGTMSRGIKHIENSSEIVFERAGVYQITFLGITRNETTYSSLALFLNGVLVKGTMYRIGSSGQTLEHRTVQAIITINAGDKLTVRNAGRRDVERVGEQVVYFADTGTNASIMITQLI